MDHIQPVRLFSLSQNETQDDGFHLDEEEAKHLRECEECQHVLAVFAREFSQHKPPHDKPEDAT